MSKQRKIVLVIVAVAALIALGAGAVWLATSSPLALRVLWMAGPIALMAIFFAVLQAILPPS